MRVEQQGSLLSVLDGPGPSLAHCQIDTPIAALVEWRQNAIYPEAVDVLIEYRKNMQPERQAEQTGQQQFQIAITMVDGTMHVLAQDFETRAGAMRARFEFSNPGETVDVECRRFRGIREHETNDLVLIFKRYIVSVTIREKLQ